MIKKLPYQGGLTRIMCRKKADWHKHQFRKDIPGIDILQNKIRLNYDIDIISFSGAGSFEDQMLSIYSFAYYAGEPASWTIYSDNSYDENQKKLLKKTFPFVEVVDWDNNPVYKENEDICAYLDVCVLCKKLNSIIGHTFSKQTLYVDSDVVFYKNIGSYLDSGLLNQGLWFSPDTLGDIAGHFKVSGKYMFPLNSGLLILNSDFNIDYIYEYFNRLKGNFGYFSEQSSFEYAMNKQHANVLDPRQFVSDADDQFDFAAKYFPEEIAARHYTSPVRHKMWQNGWMWHFSMKD